MSRVTYWNGAQLTNISRKCKERYTNPFDVIKYLNELINACGWDGMILYEIGVLYENLGMYDKAMEYYREAAEKFPLLKYKQLAFEKIRRIEQILKTQTAECAAVISHDALYVANCTRIKIWDLDPHAPPFVPAIIAYQGSCFKKFLKYVEREGIKWWLILSAKYGFIEPWHPIENYDV